MVGRNEKCLCGSGKKYKYCCLSTDNKKIIPFVQNATQFPGKCFESDDFRIADLKEVMIESYHFSKKDSDFLYFIGAQLFLAGFQEDGLLYSLEALKFVTKKKC